MPVQAPVPKPSKVVWALAAVLCACTLVALWVTGARIKAMKLAARRGEVIEPVGSADPPRGRYVLGRGVPVRVAHFSLELGSQGRVDVKDAGGRRLVEFLKLAKGELRGWQELQLVCVDASPESMTLEVEFKPGAKCFGSGIYRALRQGLQIEFSCNRTVTLTAWDPQKPELGLKVQTASADLERKIPRDGKGDVSGLSYHLQTDPGGGYALLLDVVD